MKFKNKDERDAYIVEGLNEVDRVTDNFIPTGKIDQLKNLLNLPGINRHTLMDRAFRGAPGAPSVLRSPTQHSLASGLIGGVLGTGLGAFFAQRENNPAAWAAASGVVGGLGGMIVSRILYNRAAKREKEEFRTSLYDAIMQKAYSDVPGGVKFTRIKIR